MLAYIAIYIVLVLAIGLSARLAYKHMQPGRPQFQKTSYAPLERRLLREFTAMFDAPMRTRMRKQLQYFRKRGKSWRSYGEEEYHLELYENEDLPMEDRFCFPLTAEAPLARIVFEISGKEYRMTVHGYNGRIWGWSIAPDPGTDLRRRKIHISAKSIIHHPEQVKLDSTQELEVFFREDDSLLSALLESPSIREVRAPGNLDRLLQRLNRTNTRLPDEFLELLRITDGMTFVDGKINGCRTLLRIMNRDAEFWPLAEFRNELLGVRPGDAHGRLYSMNKEERRLKRINGGFKETIISRLDTFGMPL
ncbi:hypothetical protein [Robertkochia flava]|uniref:hypothetical protein n=1 Tax=Robertkochia flava TaxID=3447986 RepID=UPI001CCF9BCF|nr:hypothetical protein [Robertkochia marina]